MRPDRDVERCPSCRGKTMLPYGYSFGAQHEECPSCAGQGFVGAGDVSPQTAAYLRSRASSAVRGDRRRLTQKFGPGYVGHGEFRP